MPDSTPTPTVSVVQPLRAVLDTNVWLDLLLFADPGCAGLRRAIDTGQLQPFLDDVCLEELRRVLAYPQWALPADRQRQLCSAASQWLEAPMAVSVPSLPRCRDPDDQKFLELAASGAARLLLTRDRDLLMLARRCRKLSLFHILAPADINQRQLPAPLTANVPSIF